MLGVNVFLDRASFFVLVLLVYHSVYKFVSEFIDDYFDLDRHYIHLIAGLISFCVVSGFSMYSIELYNMTK